MSIVTSEDGFVLHTVDRIPGLLLYMRTSRSIGYASGLFILNRISSEYVLNTVSNNRICRVVGELKDTFNSIQSLS